MDRMLLIRIIDELGKLNTYYSTVHRKKGSPEPKFTPYKLPLWLRKQGMDTQTRGSGAYTKEHVKDWLKRRNGQ